MSETTTDTIHSILSEVERRWQGTSRPPKATKPTLTVNVSVAAKRGRPSYSGMILIEDYLDFTDAYLQARATVARELGVSVHEVKAELR